MSNFRLCRRTLRTGLSVLLISTMVPSDAHPQMVTGVFFFFALPAVLASEVGHTGKTVDQKRLAPDSLIFLVPTTLPMCFSWVMFVCQDVTGHCTLAGSADSPLFVYREHSISPLLGSKHGMRSAGLRWSYADIFGVLARGASCTNVHLACLIASVQKTVLDVHDIPCQRKCQCSRL